MKSLTRAECHNSYCTLLSIKSCTSLADMTLLGEFTSNSAASNLITGLVQRERNMKSLKLNAVCTVLYIYLLTLLHGYISSSLALLTAVVYCAIAT